MDRSFAAREPIQPEMYPDRHNFPILPAENRLHLGRSVCYHRPMKRSATTTATAADRDPARGLRIARRSTMYLVRTLLFIIMGCILCIIAFLTAMRVSNLYILASEGMALRADCILSDGAQNDLEEYFTLTYLENDQALKDTTYDNYTISSYNYDLSVEKISVLPWSMKATVTAVERVSAKGEINVDQLSEGESIADYPVPEWKSRRYEIEFLNNKDRWYINNLTALAEDPASEPMGTPDLSLSPIPAATPTATPTATPAGMPESAGTAGQITVLTP